VGKAILNTEDLIAEVERLRERLRAISSVSIGYYHAVSGSEKQFVTSALVMEWLMEFNRMAMLGENMQTEGTALGG
jgi:hypothetical protein